MKTRLYKKWINRIMDEVKNLPTTTGCGWDTSLVDKDGDPVWEHGHNYTLINGTLKSEGAKYYINPDMVRNMKRTIETIRTICSKHKTVYLRQLELGYWYRDTYRQQKPYFRMRLIVEKAGEHIGCK